MAKYYSVLFISLLVCGCGSYSPSRVAVLQNPETKQTVECKVDPWGSINRRAQVDNCIETYQKAGYKLVGDSAE